LWALYCVEKRVVLSVTVIMAYLWDKKRAESMALEMVVEMDGLTVGNWDCLWAACQAAPMVDYLAD
jgi:hypothetical protein